VLVPDIVPVNIPEGTDVFVLGFRGNNVGIGFVACQLTGIDH